MLLPATHFHTLASSSSSLLLFPGQFPKPKTRPANFTIRSSTSDTQTRTLPHSAIQRIADKLRSLGFTDQPPASASTSTPSSAAGEIFVPLPHNIPKQRVGHTLDTSWSTPENPVPLPGTGIARLSANELEKQRKEREREREKKKEGKVPTLAELSLTNSEIMRLTTLGFQMKQKIKVGKAGITEGIVNGIHERWRRSEVVRIVCDDICRINMKRTHDLLERKTGGLVVWRSGSKIILYRGTDYKYPYFLSDKDSRDEHIGDAEQHMDRDDENYDEKESHSSETNSEIYAGHSSNSKTSKPALIQGVGTPNKVRFQLPGEAELAEDADSLLVGLGPRFTDWWGYEPLPVDADLLPAVVPGYRQPFRLLPYGVKPKLTDDEMTTLRRLSRPIPSHFALGRNRKLQGLATAIIKLWERCEIVKIAVKRGVQNTNSEIMAEEIKHLTGGNLLARDREFIVFYRGKDFLPAAVSSAIEQRRNIGLYKLKAVNSSSVVPADSEGNGVTFQKDTEISKKELLTKAKEAIKFKKSSIKLSMALEKKAKAEKLLAELENAESPQEQEIDKEGITEEERYMLRKIGLKMQPFLLLGRRGVFDGTVENMHLHWKYRELVKVICKEGSLEAVHQVAQTLEAESGGILVAVERVSKGYAIIVYRGKNYSRPASLRPQTLLNKKLAMKRSIEAQRYESLKLHVLNLDKNINELKLQMVKDEANSKQMHETLRSDLVKDEANSKQMPETLRSDLVTDKHGASTNSTSCNSPKEASFENQQAIQEQQVELIDGGGARPGELDSWAGSIHKETQPDIVSDSVVDAGHCVSNEKEMESSIASSKSDPEPPASIISRRSNDLPSRSVFLSNRERLLLRKQALQMKKRPVLAIGKSNTVSGIAKTIKTHFQKHPLAIVNVKGRAKGTSVQEVVFKLEQATGAVLISQEPSKVILYRGWGAGEKPGTGKKVNEMGKEEEAKPIVSPELLEAIRVECGLQ